MKTFLQNPLMGAVAGVAATAAMTVVMKALHRRLPVHERYELPPRTVTMRVADKAGVKQYLDEPEKQAAVNLAHYGYGATMAALYATATPKAAAGPATGVAYGLGVWAVSYLGLLPGLGILRPATEHPLRRNAMMIAAHVVWGGTLGALVQAYHAIKDSEKSSCSDLVDEQSPWPPAPSPEPPRSNTSLRRA